MNGFEFGFGLVMGCIAAVVAVPIMVVAFVFILARMDDLGKLFDAAEAKYKKWRAGK